MANVSFVVGQRYTKDDVYRICRVPPERQKGNWNTGYTQWNGEWFIFCNIGTAGRTGHDYANQFEDGQLNWYGKTASHIGQKSIKSLLSRQGKVHVFYRTDDRSPFWYAGEATPASFQRTTPVQITWLFQGEATRKPDASPAAAETPPTAHQVQSDLQFPEEVPRSETYGEGAVTLVSVNAYERSARAVSACKAHYGTTCVICEFNFGKVYGEIGRGYIHVHHLIQLADIGKDYEVDPIRDLRPVCPNCHSMLHQRRPPLSIEELKQIVGRN